MSALPGHDPALPRPSAQVIPLPGVKRPKRHPIRRILRVVGRVVVLLIALSLLATVRRRHRAH